jgi:hypothetical protein
MDIPAVLQAWRPKFIQKHSSCFMPTSPHAPEFNSFDIIGSHLPFCGREKELALIEASIKSQFSDWKDVAECKIPELAIKKSTVLYAADASGRGKTRLMTSGMYKVLDDKLKEHFSGLAFHFDYLLRPV